MGLLQQSVEAVVKEMSGRRGQVAQSDGQIGGRGSASAQHGSVPPRQAGDGRPSTAIVGIRLKTAFFNGLLAPDLAVEVLSEGNTRSEMERKLKDYFFSGVRLVWFVDPRTRSATVYASPDLATQMTEEASLDGGDVLPGLSIPLREVFAHLARKPEGAGPKTPPGKSTRKPRRKP